MIKSNALLIWQYVRLSGVIIFHIRIIITEVIKDHSEIIEGFHAIRA